MQFTNLIIIPFHNESEFLEHCVLSIINQTIIPDKLILVDDNSTDSSTYIAQEFASKYHWIEYLRHPSENRKEQGVKVIKAFNFGLSQIDFSEYKFISKLDADLELPVNYFESILSSFNGNSEIGICGGMIIERKNNIWRDTLQADYHIRGALKTYRLECFIEISGLKPILGWDGLDEMSAMFRGWKTQIVKSRVKHFRPASSDYNYKELCFKLGVANYCNGSNMLLAFVRGSVRSARKINIFIFYYFLKGYLTARVNKYPKNVSPELALFINKFHLKRIFGCLSRNTK